MRIRLRVVAFVVCAGSLVSRRALADTGTAEDKWTFAVGPSTDFPVQVGGRFDVEAPFRLRLNTTVGVLPSPYVSSINGILEGVGAYDAATGNLIMSTLQTSLVWRTHAGFRPFRTLGLYGDVGYGLVTLGGSAATSDLITAVTGKSIPQQDASGTKSFDAAATLHMLDVEIGWVFRVTEHLRLRAALGGAFTLGSSASLTARFTPRAPAAIAQFEKEGEDYLNHTFRTYVFTPTVSVGGAYAF